MQHDEVEEEAFVVPDTQGDSESPFIAPTEWGAYTPKLKKKPSHLKPRNHEPTLVGHTEPGDVVEVEGALFIIVRKCSDGRWAHTWLIDDTSAPLNIDSYKTGQDHKTGPFFIPGHFPLGRVLMLRPPAWR